MPDYHHQTLRDDPYYQSLVTTKRLYENSSQNAQISHSKPQISQPENPQQVKKLLSTYKKEMIYLKGGMKSLREYENSLAPKSKTVQFADQNQSAIQTQESLISSVPQYAVQNSFYSQQTDQIEAEDENRPTLEQLEFYKNSSANDDGEVFSPAFADDDYSSLAETNRVKDEIYGNESPPTPPPLDPRMRPQVNFEVPVSSSYQQTVCQTGSFFQSKSAKSVKSNPDELTLEDFEDVAPQIKQDFSDCLVDDGSCDLQQSVIRTNPMKTCEQSYDECLGSTKMMKTSFNPLRTAVMSSLGISQSINDEIPQRKQIVNITVSNNQEQFKSQQQYSRPSTQGAYLQKIKEESEHIRQKKLLEMQKLLQK